MDKLLSQKEIASILEVHPNTIKNWRTKGLPYVMVNGRPRYWSSQVIEWINNNEEKN